MSLAYFCCDERRREAVRDHPTLNGIDFLEVLDQDAPSNSPRQQTLLVHCLKPIWVAPEEDPGTAPTFLLTQANVQIEGGERITPVRVMWAYPAISIPDPLVTAQEQSFFTALPQPENILVVRTDSSGDYSIYRFVLVQAPDNRSRPENFDPIIRQVDFSFKVECPSEFDCESELPCPPELRPEPDIDYLAKDYDSFRQLMLDRMAVLLPQWRERNPADIGVALVELLAYVGDHLSYTQDAIATEAYLDTAQHRISVRRHARLVDYPMHDGCNARVWLQLQVNTDTRLEAGERFLTRLPGHPPRLTNEAYQHVLVQQPEVFESMHPALLYPSHNQIYFYTWGDENCCLPKGATRATLRDSAPSSRLHLMAGDILIFTERISPTTGLPTDADTTRRHAVRLTSISPEPIITRNREGKIIRITPGTPIQDPLTEQPIVEIAWHEEDALPFPFCLSSYALVERGEQQLENISVVLGNVVLADHGRTVEEPLASVPEPILFYAAARTNHCKPRQQTPIAPRYTPRLTESPVTQAATVPGNSFSSAPDALPSATAAFRWQFQDVLPAITLNADEQRWTPQRDLLGSDRFAREFVAEVDNRGQTHLRFGRGQDNGLAPPSGTRLVATYRVGNGTQGNVGAATITHIVSNNSAIDTIWNPLAARQGMEPESIAATVHSAPFAFQTQERAVTPEDWAMVAQRHPGVQRAAATFRWTGSWHTVFLTLDRLRGLPVDAAFEQEMRDHLERYRLAGYDLEIDAPRYVPLEVAMQVCVLPSYFRSDVKAALFEVLSDRVLPDGRLGAFHPDNFTFGQSVYLSRLYSTAQAVAGVASVSITTFQRQGQADTRPLETGNLMLGRLEIAQLQNDPNFPERGVLRLQMEGGK